MDLAAVFDRSDREPEVTFIIGGPDAEGADVVIRKLLGEVPHITESWAGIWSTKTPKKATSLAKASRV